MKTDLARLRACTDDSLRLGWAVSARSDLDAERSAADARDAEKDAEIARLRSYLENTSWRLSTVLRLWGQADCHTELESIRDAARDAAALDPK